MPALAGIEVPIFRAVVLYLQTEGQTERAHKQTHQIIEVLSCESLYRYVRAHCR